MNRGIVLSVDDNEDDRLLLRRAWKKIALLRELKMVSDGEKAIEYLCSLGDYADRTQFPMPEIILLDLKMPRKNGFEVLEWMSREFPEHPPVAVFTSSQNAADIEDAYKLGAKWYFAKPITYTELVQWVEAIGQWFQNPQENGLSGLLNYRAPYSAD